MVAISGTLHSTFARRVTAVPLRSWNVSPLIPAFLAAVCHAVRNVWLSHGRPRLLVRMIGERLGAASRAALSGAPTGMMTRLPVFDCFNRMCVPSYADHDNRKR